MMPQKSSGATVDLGVTNPLFLPFRHVIVLNTRHISPGSRYVYEIVFRS